MYKGIHDRAFKPSLSSGKYTRWAVRLDNGTIQSILWLLGEFGARTRGTNVQYHTVQVCASRMDTRRVAEALRALAEIVRGKRIDIAEAMRRIGDSQQIEYVATAYDDWLLVRRLPETALPPAHHHWTVSFEEAHVRALASANALIACIDWQENAGTKPQPVGSFAFDPSALVQRELAWVNEDDEIEMRLFRDFDGCICLAGYGGSLALGRPVELPADAS